MKSYWSVVAAILAVHVSLLAWSAQCHSPNANEPSHLAAGISHWTFGRFELYRVNPPLVRMVASLPVLPMVSKTDWSNFSSETRARSEFTVGPDFITANGEQSLLMIRIARWACFPFSVLGALACLYWSRELYGPIAGLVSILLWCFSPDILGHASCITPDAHATAVGLAASYLFWRWLQESSWRRALLASLLLGLALLSKSTWLILVLLWPILWGIGTSFKSADRRNILSKRCMEGCQLVVMLLVAIHIVNMAYLYDGTFRRLGDFKFISASLSGRSDGADGNRFRSCILGQIPIPFPDQYVIGIDVQKQDFEQHPPSYFGGKIYDHGHWAFYLYAFALKTPIGTLLLAAVTMILVLGRRQSERRMLKEIPLLMPAVAILILVSAQTEYTTHLRYAMPALPVLFIWVSQLAGDGSVNSPTRLLLIAGLSWSLGSSLWFAPHWLSYFNEIAGGPKHGHEYLANSNLDWGQDLLYLKRWQADHPELQPMGLAYYGMFHPNSIGIKFEDVPRWDVEASSSVNRERNETSIIGPRTGWFAVSANFVVGHPFWVYRADGTRTWTDHADYTWFRPLNPVDRAGYSIFIYHVTPADVQYLQQEFVDSWPTRVTTHREHAAGEQIPNETGK